MLAITKHIEYLLTEHDCVLIPGLGGFVLQDRPARFSTEEFTKYSFPSKNMEYMASGTPLLTTKLPGMPKEYHHYVFLFKEETIDGYATAIREALSLSDEDLRSLGQKASQFVLLNKNNVQQGKRLLDFIEA